MEIFGINRNTIGLEVRERVRAISLCSKMHHPHPVRVLSVHISAILDEVLDDFMVSME